VRKAYFLLHVSKRSERLARRTALEIGALYGVPGFTKEERHLSFDMSFLALSQRAYCAVPRSSERVNCKVCRLILASSQYLGEQWLPKQEPNRLPWTYA